MLMTGHQMVATAIRQIIVNIDRNNILSPNLIIEKCSVFCAAHIKCSKSPGAPSLRLTDESNFLGGRYGHKDAVTRTEEA
mmetsp:Transcript_32564/g.64568  ORF Transcript_32564/g.64568 Transcript_32564/m.64568 type:complete len:80 (-) Transcript_32564:933-1172(-)